MTPTEKHRETAERIVSVLDASQDRYADCPEAEGIRSAYQELRQKSDFTTASVKARAGYLAAALAKAEREGMKRAAEIARQPVVFSNQVAVEACTDFMEAWEMGADDAIDGIVQCILSEAGEGA